MANINSNEIKTTDPELARRYLLQGYGVKCWTYSYGHYVYMDANHTLRVAGHKSQLSLTDILRKGPFIIQSDKSRRRDIVDQLCHEYRAKRPRLLYLALCKYNPTATIVYNGGSICHADTLLSIPAKLARVNRKTDIDDVVPAYCNGKLLQFVYALNYFA